ncbi:amidohydrolase [Campylobacter novaezeelandiae]|uniref:Amidohydrolase n=1 Tax=Campylobacter novaezeelandiae TaxID=2267891 RepID=A0A4Q9JWI5_9BACT|nr:amidohydrolase family protein [Campylobacter novaezeelandiae]TBR80812.1 amidohydrolase [Campylobacter novaezeelandiae]TBR81410.1 amidohydrolase [Campylobacter novaezeelandiae]
MQKIFDAHLHLWDLEKVNISWLKNDKRLEQNFDFLKAKKEYKNFDFIGAMYVESDSDDKHKEALYALNLKQNHKLKLCLANLEYKKDLCAFREVMHTSFKGAKRLFEDDFKKIIELLIKENIVFEACVKNEELFFLQEFLNQNPNLKVVLDHMGSPKESRFNEYKKDLKSLKEFSNLYIKFSAPDDFSNESSKEFIFELFAFLKENFNEDKFIFGSNYPVTRLSPNEWANLIIESKVFKELDKIFFKNALSLYKGV